MAPEAPHGDRPGLALLAGVGRVAGERFFSSQIDGAVPAEGRELQVDRVYIQNTSEQLLLLLVAHAGLALVLSAGSLGVIPLLVALFLVGRVTFWTGYLRSPPGPGLRLRDHLLPDRRGILLRCFSSPGGLRHTDLGIARLA